jgi:hypothetical protein
VPDQALPFSSWCKSWLALARFTGDDVPDADERIAAALTLWTAPVPGGWEREVDERLLDRARRYQRGDAESLTSGSEHELEHQILAPDPNATTTHVFGARLADGVNAVPLTRDPAGGRRDNVEADMLLVLEAEAEHRVLIGEAKTTSNDCWYAAIENLRQLKLYQLSHSAQAIPGRRNPALGGAMRADGVVVAPERFYTAAGRRSATVEPTLRLLAAIRDALEIHVQLATWREDCRQIDELASA